jgi:hypothetical protein
MIKYMLIPWILGVLSLIYTYRIDKSYLRIDVKALKGFGIFLLWLTLIRSFIFTISQSMPMSDILPLINPWLMLGVFWEDAIHVMPLIILKDKEVINKYVYYALFACSALVFASGHMYQGWIGLASILYMYFSAKYGRKHGFGTVMICHTAYDLTTYFGALAFAGGQ